VSSANAFSVSELKPVFRGADVVFHLVAHVHDVSGRDDVDVQQRVTFGSTQAAIGAAEVAEVAGFVFASSVAVYGNTGETRATEDVPYQPTTPYGRAKVRSEEALRAYAERTGAFASCVQPPLIYGVGCPGNLQKMIRAIRSGVFPPIPEFHNRRNMIGVADVVKAMVGAWRANVRGGRAFILTDGIDYSTRQIYDLIYEALGRGRVPFSLPRTVFSVAAAFGDAVFSLSGRRLPFDGQVMESLAGSSIFSAERARRELCFTPTTRLQDAMLDIVRDC
jgi:nucleoside-diphosphate-sugar epimerase